MLVKKGKWNTKSSGRNQALPGSLGAGRENSRHGFLNEILGRFRGDDRRCNGVNAFLRG